MSTVIKVENISKQYRLGDVGTGALAHDLNRTWHKLRGKEDPYSKIGEANDRTVKGSSDYVWALQDINFEVNQGEVLGIIGRNGAGKSTLLKILSRTTTPTTGKINIKGRVASLLEVGTGFHPELSGRENIFLNGAILGMTRQEIKSKFDEIVDFAGVERYIDTPVKRYSSGMYVRLAFAVAAHLEPEILIVDEVLAVGDAEFQKKALGKMKDISKGEGRTVLFVSHNMSSVQKLCTSAVFMENGQISLYGDTEEVISRYFNNTEKSDLLINAEVHKTEYININKVSIASPNTKYIKNGQEIKVEIIIDVVKRIKFNPVLYVYRNSQLAFFSSDFHCPIFSEINEEGQYAITFIIPKYLLNPGKIQFDLGMISFEGRIEQLIKIENVLYFDLADDNFRRGEIYSLGWEGALSPILKYDLEKL
jgi:lipopolysaccharide transport system ATP-binding protein